MSEIKKSFWRLLTSSSNFQLTLCETCRETCYNERKEGLEIHENESTTIIIKLCYDCSLRNAKIKMLSDRKINPEMLKERGFQQSYIKHPQQQKTIGDHYPNFESLIPQKSYHLQEEEEEEKNEKDAEGYTLYDRYKPVGPSNQRNACYPVIR